MKIVCVRVWKSKLGKSVRKQVERGREGISGGRKEREEEGTSRDTKRSVEGCERLQATVEYIWVETWSDEKV